MDIVLIDNIYVHLISQLLLTLQQQNAISYVRTYMYSNILIKRGLW